MALSGSFDFNETCSEIVTDALRAMNQLGRGETASANQLSEGRSVLNKMVKMWQGKNIFLWTLDWLQQPVIASDQVTGTDGNIYTCVLCHTSATATNKPITGTNWRTYWTLAGTTGGTWSNAHAYVSSGDFAVTSYKAIEQAFIRKESGDYPIPVIYRREFFNLTDKTSIGTPELIYFNPLLTNRAYVRPIPEDTTETIHYSAVKLLNDFDSTSDDPDFPSFGLMALTTNLAYWWSRNFGMDPQARAQLKDDAREAFKYLNAGNKEITSPDGIKPAWTVGRSAIRRIR